MIPYIIIFFILSSFHVFQILNRNTIIKSIGITLAVLSLVLIASIRNEIGTDWSNYFELFQNVDLTPWGESGLEFLFEMIVRFDKMVWDNYNFHLFVTSLIILIPTSYFLFKYSPLPIYSLILLFGYSINSSGFGYRQDIAIAICMLSMIFVFSKKFKLFIMTVGLASLFHQSALIFIITYFLINLNLNIYTLILIELAIILGIQFSLSSSSFFMNLYTESAAQKLESYLLLDKEEAFIGIENSTTKFTSACINRFILIIPSIYIGLKHTNPILKNLNILIVFGAIIYIGFFNYGYVFTRLARYFEIFSIVTIPLGASLITKTKRQILLLLFYLLSLFKLLMVIINDDHIYTPYNHIL